MRMLSFATVAAAAFGLAAAAQAQTVTVNIGSSLDRKSRDLGHDEVASLARDLERQVARTLEQRGALEGARVELTLTDVAPNRPTMQQMTDRPGLSYFHSFGIGGAAIEGQVVTADGDSRPVRFNWYSTDIRDARAHGTWEDVNRAFMRFSRRLADGRL